MFYHSKAIFQTSKFLSIHFSVFLLNEKFTDYFYGNARICRSVFGDFTTKSV